MNGNFVNKKTCQTALAPDQVHEQLNALVKGNGGIIGITENENALEHWVVGGPQLAQIVSEYESHNVMKKDNEQHHEQIPRVQKAFLSQVKDLVPCGGKTWNPFR